jgi:hypothetical protein
MVKRLYFIFAAIITVLAVSPSYGHDINGFVSGEWLLADSPYFVTGAVTVSAGAALTIEAGVEVQFNLGTKLTVYGLLDAQGTSEGMITFTSTMGASSARNDWEGLVFTTGASASLMKYCRIAFASPKITLCTMTTNESAIMLSNSSSTIEANYFASNYPYTIYCDTNATPNIYLNTIKYDANATGIGCMQATTHPFITANTFESYGAASKGILLQRGAYADITGNRFNSAGQSSFGIACLSGNVRVTGNTSLRQQGRLSEQ